MCTLNWHMFKYFYCEFLIQYFITMLGSSCKCRDKKLIFMSFYSASCTKINHIWPRDKSCERRNTHHPTTATNIKRNKSCPNHEIKEYEEILQQEINSFYRSISSIQWNAQQLPSSRAQLTINFNSGTKYYPNIFLIYHNIQNGNF
jgi:hypothetical protein